MKLNEFKKTVKESGQFNIANKASEIDSTLYLRENQVKSYPSFKKLAYSAFSIVFIAIVALFGYMNYKPVTTLTIDFNPSLEVEVNIFNRVIDINSNNSEGNDFIEDISYKNKSLDYVLNEIYIEGIEQSYFTESEAYILIGVYGESIEAEENIDAVIESQDNITFISLLEHDLDFSKYTTNLETNSNLENNEEIEGALDNDMPSYNNGDEGTVTTGDSTPMVTDTLSITLDIDQLARIYGVSNTKIILILEIIDYYPEYTLEESFSDLIQDEIADLYILYSQMN